MAQEIDEIDVPCGYRVVVISGLRLGGAAEQQSRGSTSAVARRLETWKGRCSRIWARPIGQHINPGELRSRWQRGVKLVEWYEIRQTVRRALRRNNLAAHERLSTRVGHRHRRADWENDGPGSALLASTDDMAILVWRRDRSRSGPT